MFDVKIVAETKFDIQTFLAIADQATGTSPAKPADSSGQQITDVAKPAYFLKGLRDNLFGFDQRDLAHSSVTVMMIGPDDLMMDIWAVCVGCKFQVASTKRRNLCLVVATGNLTHWQAAVAEGLKTDMHDEFMLMYRKFVEAGYDHLWKHFKRQEDGGRLRLTYQP